MGKNYQNYLNVNSEIMETKKCTACGSVLPISEFHTTLRQQTDYVTFA
jgi:hypothetical protein